MVDGRALLRADIFDEALPFLRAVVAAFAEHPGLYNELISISVRLGLLDEVRECVAMRNKVAPRCGWPSCAAASRASSTASRPSKVS